MPTGFLVVLKGHATLPRTPHAELSTQLCKCCRPSPGAPSVTAPRDSLGSGPEEGSDPPRPGLIPHTVPTARSSSGRCRPALPTASRSILTPSAPASLRRSGRIEDRCARPTAAGCRVPARGSCRRATATDGASERMRGCGAGRLWGDWDRPRGACWET